ncbi:MAG: MFS transporter [Deltaproteobacteria bacterium]|nr:MFS transporter [Deltaproteobacteria bacterium]
MNLESELVIQHTPAFKTRRFLNWFPLGLTYAMLYMGRYNLTVAKNNLGDLMTKEDFGLIFGAGTMVYAFAFLLNGPLVDKLGGKKGILAAAIGSAVMNFLLGLFIRIKVLYPGLITIPLVPAMALLYSMNMYFQSFGAVSIVKVNAHWFHVRERGGFSGIFGTMIASGIFFAFTVNDWFLEMLSKPGSKEATPTWWVFFLPSILLGSLAVVELVILKDRPGQAGFEDFDTGDASSGQKGDEPVFKLIKRILTHPIIITVALIEFCTGVLRNGVMHWFPFYTKEVWALPGEHPLRHGSWGNWELVVVVFAVAAVLFVLSVRAKGKKRAWLLISGGLVALAPFMQAGWGGMLFVAGVIGGNVAGWVSDLFFQSRRAPAAAGLYLLLTVCVIGMFFFLGGTEPKVGWVRQGSPLKNGDEIVQIQGKTGFRTWTDVARTIACIPSKCIGKGVRWDTARCMCSSRPKAMKPGIVPSNGLINIKVRRNGELLDLTLKDNKTSARAGEKRRIGAGPVLTMTPYLLGIIVFLVSFGVIGTHGLLSGTATMDFGGSKGAATAVGMIDGFVYLGTAVQSISLGFLTTKSWSYWPMFLLPFAIIGFFLLTRIWNAVPKGGGH